MTPSTYLSQPLAVAPPEVPLVRAARKNPLARFPIVAYFVLAYAGTWLVLLPVVLAQGNLGVLPYSMPFAVLAVLFILSAFTGPTLAAFVVTGATEGRAGVGRLLRRYVLWRVGPQWYLLVLFGYVAFYLSVGGIALGGLPIETLAPKWPLLFTAYLPAVLTFNLVTSLGEEPGWRGFALPHLQRKYGALPASLILGTLHAFWHLPVFFIAMLGFGQLAPQFFATWIPAVWATTIVWTWIFNSTKGSLLIAILLHAAFDAAGSFVLSQLLVLNTAPLAVKQWAAGAELALFIGAALFVLALTRGRLGYKRT
jgi:membrane protease YdiL (CAAX protease family)